MSPPGSLLQPWGSEPPKRPRWIVPLVVALAVGGGVLLVPSVKRGVVRLVDRMRTERVVVKREVVEKIVEKRVEVPVPTPPPALPEGPSLSSQKDAATMFSGVKVVSKIEPEKGKRATTERGSADSYQVEVTVKVRVPEAARTYEELCGINPALPGFFPELRDLLKRGKVSGFYHHAYAVKQAAVKTNILRLDRLLSRHNFYDLETALELEGAEGKQKALWLQGEMDVVSDGSDGDRMESFDDYLYKSQHFQPSTSYGWAKVTDKVNPLVPRLEAELAEFKAKVGGAGSAEKKSMQARIAELPTRIGDLKKRSYLIAQEDPFVVIPLSFRSFKGSSAYTPSIGDYAVVICGEKMLPAIVGDYGPSEKCGEASLRIAREIDPKAGPYNRPVSDLKVTYLIFPGSAEKPRQPDYEEWHAKCSELLGKLGADPAKLHHWEDRLKAKLAVPVVVPEGGEGAAGAAAESAVPEGGGEKENPIDPVSKKP